MKDFIGYDISGNRSQKDAFDNVVRALPDFVWHQGDSDSQGPYVSGKNDDRVLVEIWLGEEPIALSVSFRRAWLDSPDRERLKEQLIARIEGDLIAVLGLVLRADK